MTMRIGLPIVIVCLLALSVSSASALPRLIGEGSIQFYDDGGTARGLDAYSYWASPSTTLSWEVWWTGDIAFGYTYTYWLTVPEHAVSHLILETSDNLTLDNIRNVSGTFAGDYDWELGDFTTGPSNENMPSSIHGIKFELGGEYTTLTFSFDCTRDPVWGDFYARDGKGGDPYPAALWNLGFTNPDTDPDYPAGNLSDMQALVGWHVLTPDSTYSGLPPDDSPEAATWVLLAATGIVGVIRRRRK